MQVVILAAGYGLRLRPLTEKVPKGLVSVLGRPLLSWTLECLPANIDEIIFITGWLGNQITNVFGSSYKGRPIHYLSQKTINGTGTALECAKALLQKSFLVINGDDIYAAEDLRNLANSPSWGMLATTTIKPLPGALQTDRQGFVTGIQQDSSDLKKWVNCGAYITDTDILNLPLSKIAVRGSVEYSLPHTLIQEPKMHPVRLFKATRWLPVGNPEELAKAEKILQNI